MACLQYGSERRDRVQRGGKARIERHLNDSLDDFLARRADIERGGEMYFQLWSGIPHDRQRGDRRQFARLQVETGTAVNVAEAEFDDVAAERSEEHPSELQSLMRISYAVFCLKK